MVRPRPTRSRARDTKSRSAPNSAASTPQHSPSHDNDDDTNNNNDTESEFERRQNQSDLVVEGVVQHPGNSNSNSRPATPMSSVGVEDNLTTAERKARLDQKIDALFSAHEAFLVAGKQRRVLEAEHLFTCERRMLDVMVAAETNAAQDELRDRTQRIRAELLHDYFAQLEKLAVMFGEDNGLESPRKKQRQNPTVVGAPMLLSRLCDVDIKQDLVAITKGQKSNRRNRRNTPSPSVCEDTDTSHQRGRETPIHTTPNTTTTTNNNNSVSNAATASPVSSSAATPVPAGANMPTTSPRGGSPEPSSGAPPPTPPQPQQSSQPPPPQQQQQQQAVAPSCVWTREDEDQLLVQVVNLVEGGARTRSRLIAQLEADKELPSYATAREIEKKLTFFEAKLGRKFTQWTFENFQPVLFEQDNNDSTTNSAPDNEAVMQRFSQRISLADAEDRLPFLPAPLPDWVELQQQPALAWQSPEGLLTCTTDKAANTKSHSQDTTGEDPQQQQQDNDNDNDNGNDDDNNKGNQNNADDPNCKMDTDAENENNHNRNDGGEPSTPPVGELDSTAEIEGLSKEIFAIFGEAAV